MTPDPEGKLIVKAKFIIDANGCLSISLKDTCSQANSLTQVRPPSFMSEERKKIAHARVRSLSGMLKPQKFHVKRQPEIHTRNGGECPIDGRTMQGTDVVVCSCETFICYECYRAFPSIHCGTYLCQGKWLGLDDEA